MIQSKQAQIHLQFSWIFVIVVGAILLGFFFSLSTTQTNVAETSITVSVARQIDTILTTTGQKDGTFKEYDSFPERELEFFCNEHEGLYHYEIGGTRVGSTQHDIVFTPKRFMTNSLQTWTLEWKIPYSVATFMYVIPKDHAFVFFDDGSRRFRSLYEAFPTNMTHIVVNSSTISTTLESEANYNSYTYVIPNSVSEMDINGVIGDQSHVVNITPMTSSLFDYGNVTFYTGDEFTSGDDGDTSFYIGKASMFQIRKNSMIALWTKHIQNYDDKQY